MNLTVFMWSGLVVFCFGSELPLAALGGKIFLDTSLSNPPGQGCVSCHSPKDAFADPRRVSPGAVEGAGGATECTFINVCRVSSISKVGRHL